MKKRKNVLRQCELFFLLTAAVCSHVNAQEVDSVTSLQDSIPAAYFKPSALSIMFGQQKESRLVQSLSYLNGKELEKSPVPLLSHAFQGRIAGLYVNQNSGTPRYDAPSLSIRGRNPLIVIDGIPRYGLSVNDDQNLYDVLSLNPEQIESITLLKDGLSTAVLGNRGMNGVLMVTTRKKSNEAHNYISVKAQGGVQSPLGLRKPISSAQYATLYNEALANDGLPPLYTPSDIENYKSGADPYLYPNVNWYNTLLRDNASITRYTINAAGSSRLLNYFVSIDYQDQNGLLKEDAANAYSTNINFKRYIVRSNIGINIDKYLSAYLNVFGTIHDYIEPGNGSAAIFSGILSTPSNAYPVLNFDGTYGGNVSYRNNLWAQSTGTGYLKNNLQAGSFDLGIKRDLGDVMKGLWAKAVLSYSPAYEQRITRTKSFPVFQYPITGDTTTYSRYGTATVQTNTSDILARMQQAYSEVSIGYDREYENHAISGLLLGNYESVQWDRFLNQVTQGLATRWNYSFKDKYIVEVAASYYGNNRFAPGKQSDFFPAVGASWNIHNESFFNTDGGINFLKVRASYGKVGDANPGYYLYKQNYVSSSGYFFGSSATNSPGVRQADLANPNRVTEKALKFNAGFDIRLFNNRAWLTTDYYNNKQYDLLQIRGYNSSVMGQVFPLENIGVNKYYGVEVTAGWADKVSAFKYFVELNVSTRQSKNIDIDEPAQAYSWMYETGLPVEQIRGYVAEGLFQTSNLNQPTIEGYTPVPGDIKYKDLNGDGVINMYDKTIIGNQKPLVFYGLNMGIQIKGFDLSILLQGVKNRDILTTGNYTWEFQSNGRGALFEHVLDRYTTDNTNASYPRLSVGTNRNNHVVSSFWVKNADYLRLRNVELGYAFGGAFLRKIKMHEIRLFVNGQNLFTTSNFKDSDPEVFRGQYPLLKVLNGGISIKL